MARKTKKAEKVSVFDLFDDIASEPLQMGDEIGGPLVLESFEETQDSSTISLEAAMFSQASTTVSGD